jgi:hypothetical protein
MTDPYYENPIDLLDNVPKDLANLSTAKRQEIYNKVCRQMGLHPNSFPLDQIKGKNGSIVLAINEIGTSQLRHNHGISTSIKSQELLPYEDKVYDPDRGEISVTRHLAIVTVIATCGGRSEEATGAVEAFGPMVRSIALKKAETQARRRATLAICGNGWSKPKLLPKPLQIPIALMGDKADLETLEVIQLPTIPREVLHQSIIPRV